MKRIQWFSFSVLCCLIFAQFTAHSSLAAAKGAVDIGRKQSWNRNSQGFWIFYAFTEELLGEFLTKERKAEFAQNHPGVTDEQFLRIGPYAEFFCKEAGYGDLISYRYFQLDLPEFGLDVIVIHDNQKALRFFSPYSHSLLLPGVPVTVNSLVQGFSSLKCQKPTSTGQKD